MAVEIPEGNRRQARAQITYAALDAASNALAQRLRAFIRGECLVCILLPRTSGCLYAAQLAVLKSGAAYTCIDPSFPDERVREILEDTDAVVLLTDSAGLARTASSGPDSLIRLDVEAELAEPMECGDVVEVGSTAPWLTPENLAYVIYTSGTTGRPKGVMIEHRGIANLVESDLEAYQLSPADRVAQGSSAAYDSSVEETWLAFSAGATLVVMDDDAARSGPDLIPWLRAERITVLCPPPTLLQATGCNDPGTVLPDLRLLYVGGETLPGGLAGRWSQGRQLVNGYGPTECTVTCLRERIEPGEPITIGRPVRGVKAWVLTETLEESAPGERGELCIGGICLARGYWKDPEQTSEKFLTHPRLGRIYRTGDLAHCDAAGRYFCHGRMDSQVKVRGYRIELGEIEERLAGCPGVRAAACRVQEHGGSAELVAFVVPEDPARPPSAGGLKAELARMLPAYMVPVRIGALSHLPKTAGGKLNRAALPRLDEAGSPTDTERLAPRSALEAKIQSAFTRILGYSKGDSLHEDFFDLGGDSLRAAQLITLLRDDPATAWLTVRDVYEARTVAALAACAPRAPLSAESARARFSGGSAPETALGHAGFVTFVQTAWLLKDLVISSALAYAGVFVVLPAVTAALGPIPLLLLAPPAALAGLALYSVLSVRHASLVKRLLIGRYKPMRAPVWGSFYLRNWLVQQTVRLIPWWLIEGTEFQNVALRALGARIGERVHIHSGVDLRRGGWDLLLIGDDVTIAQDVALGLVEYEAGYVVVGEVSLGNGATLETNSYVGSGARVGDNGHLTARSSLTRGGRIPPSESWDGIPARHKGTAPERKPFAAGERTLSPWAAGIWTVLARLALTWALAAPSNLLTIGAVVFFGADDETVMAWLMAPTLSFHLLLAWVLVVVLPVPLMLAVEALACRVMGRVRPGLINLLSLGYIRVWLKARLVESASRWLYGTLLMPLWLRLAGTKVGRGCEISSLIDTVPELIEIGDYSFCTDGIYLGGARIHRGAVTLAPCQLGRNNFLGNGAIVPGGVCLPDDVLLGVCTTADPSRIRAGTSWFGHPAFELPRREVVAFDRRLTHNPSAIRYLVRVFWELLRFALPAAAALVTVVWCALLAEAQVSLSLPVLLLAAAPILTFGAFAATTGFVVAIKWVLMGRVRPGVYPLWSSWVSRWDFFCLAWSLYAVGVVRVLDGTLWLAWLLRAVGVHVGTKVVFGHRFAEGLATPDMLRFEDGATVDCLFQDHTFEDRVLKMDYVRIRRNATVGRNAVLLYGAAIGEASYVAPNSVVMKHERLPAGQNYAGFPVRRQDGDGW